MPEPGQPDLPRPSIPTGETPIKPFDAKLPQGISVSNEAMTTAKNTSAWGEDEVRQFQKRVKETGMLPKIRFEMTNEALDELAKMDPIQRAQEVQKANINLMYQGLYGFTPFPDAKQIFVVSDPPEDDNSSNSTPQS